MEVPLGKRNAFPPQNHKQRNRYTDGLRKGCAECRTRRTEVKRANEKIIQHDICRTCNRNEIHRAFAVTHATENGADDVICRNKGIPESKWSDMQLCRLPPPAGVDITPTIRRTRSSSTTVSTMESPKRASQCCRRFLKPAYGFCRPLRAQC